MTVQTQEFQLVDALRTVAVNGSYNASRALSKWLHRGVRLTTDGFSDLPISQAASAIGEPDDVIAAVHLPLAGDISGHMLLAFPEAAALQLVDVMIGQPEGTAIEFGEMEQSCLEETGNIVCSAYANSLSKWLDLHIEPQVPHFVHDMACAIVDPMIMDLATHRDTVLVAHTDFLLDAQSLEWAFMLVPSHASLISMTERCDLEHARQQAMQTIAINGAFEASRAVSKWLRRGVKLSTDGFSRVPFNQMAAGFDESKPVVALHLPLREQLHGHTLLVMPFEHALQLVDILLGQEPWTTKEIGELEQSALEETGNIVSSAFVNSWAKWLDIRVEPGAPQFAFDLPGAIMESVVSEQALMSDDVFMAKTEFVISDQCVEWVFALLPAPSAMRLIETSCQ